MLENQNILIVDDHPFIIEAYKNILKSYNPKTFHHKVTQASDCKSAYDVITSEDCPLFDIAFLDISMPSYEEKKLFSGEDIAKLLLEYQPQCKVVLLTMHTELIKISNIIKEINPRGLVIKNDLTFDELLSAINKIVNDETYYSQTVVKFISQATANDHLNIDDYDRQILRYLSKGVKTKDLPSFVPLSLSAVEKRKLNLKEQIVTRGASDIDLIQEAKNLGLI